MITSIRDTISSTMEGMRRKINRPDLIARNKSVQQRLAVSRSHKKPDPLCVDCGAIVSARTVTRCRACRTSYALDERHPRWKGDAAGYSALHRWLASRLGKPERCEHCGETGLKAQAIHWASKSRKCLRDESDWLRLCAQCHWNYDASTRHLVGERHPFYGRMHSAETKALISAQVKEAMANPDVRRRLSQAKKGKPPWNKGLHFQLP